MQYLPAELLSHIFSFTSVETRGRCARVCRTWNEIITNTDSLWHDEELQDRPDTLTIKQHRNAKYLEGRSTRRRNVVYIALMLSLWLVSLWMKEPARMMCNTVFRRVETLDDRIGRLETLSSNGPWLVDGYVEARAVCVPVTNGNGVVCVHIPATYERIRLIGDDTWSEGSWHVNNCSVRQNLMVDIISDIAFLCLLGLNLLAMYL